MSTRAFIRVLNAMGTNVPVLAVLTEGGLIAISGEWVIDDFVAATGETAEAAHASGIRAAVAAPIVVDGRVWGMIAAGRRQ